MKPTVSIICNTFNHGLYIGQCIDGFICQKTNFIFEVLIHDDASTDNTQEIIKEYQNKYPDIIKPILQVENQYQKGKNNWVEFQFPRATGKYIALCEGDDYWTDPLKLQKQVDFLEKNPEFAICHHNVKVINQDDSSVSHLSNPNQKHETNIIDLCYKNYIYTQSSVFRNCVFPLPKWFEKLEIGDYPLFMLIAQQGKIKFLDEVMAVYRINTQGIWSTKQAEEKQLKWIEMLNYLIRHFENPEIKNLLIKSQLSYVTTVLGNNPNANFKTFPQGFIHLYNDFGNLEYKYEVLKNKYDRLNNFLPIKILKRIKKVLKNK